MDDSGHDKRQADALKAHVVHVLREGAALTFKIVGQGTMKEAPGVVRCAERALADADSPARRIRVDLSEATYLDSTFLGTLLTLNKAAGRHEADGGVFEVVSPSKACGQLLNQMGIDQRVRIVHETTPGDAAWCDLSEEGEILPAAIQETVVIAHEALAQVPGKAQQTFASVAAKLRKAYDAERGTARAEALTEDDTETQRHRETEKRKD